MLKIINYKTMEINNIKTESGGIGFRGLLTIAFIVLKLTGYIDWSWWWVVSPIWIPIVLIIAVYLICAIICAIISYFFNF